MSWFDTAGIANFAKSALTTAQKTIDKALDIQEDATAKVEKQVIKKNESENFFEAFGVSDKPSTSNIVPKQPATTGISGNLKTVPDTLSPSQGSGFWTDTWGSFFELKSQNTSKDQQPHSVHAEDLSKDNKHRETGTVLFQPHRATLFPGDPHVVESSPNMTIEQNVNTSEIVQISNLNILASENSAKAENIPDIEKCLPIQSNTLKTQVVVEQPSVESKPLISDSLPPTSSLGNQNKKPTIKEDTTEKRTPCDKNFNNETKESTTVPLNSIENTDKITTIVSTEVKLDQSEFLDLNILSQSNKTEEMVDIERNETEMSISSGSFTQLTAISEDSHLCANKCYSYESKSSTLVISEKIVSDSEIPFEEQSFDGSNSTLVIADYLPMNVPGNVANWECCALDSLEPDLFSTDDNDNANYLVNENELHINQKLSVPDSASLYQSDRGSTFPGTWPQSSKPSQSADESRLSSNGEQNSHHSDGSSNSSKDDDDTDTAEVKEYDAKSSSSHESNTTSSSSFVKCSAEESDNNFHRGPSPVSTTASERSDITKQEFEQNTSGDENETATSSDIEILSPPNGENGDRNASPLKHVWLPRSLRLRRSESPTSDSSKDSLMPVVSELDEVSYDDENNSLTTLYGDKGDEDCQQNYEDANLRNLLQKQNDLQTVLDAREKKIVELSKENIELQENEQRLKNLMQKMRVEQAKESRDITSLTREFTKKLAFVESQLKDALQERSLLQQQMEESKLELDKRILVTDMEDVMKEKDIQIEELTQEGQKLAKKELQQSTLIKKLRAKDDELSKNFKSQSEKLEENEKEVDRLRKSISAKEEQEKKHIDIIRNLNNSIKKLEKEVSCLKSDSEDSKEKEHSLKRSLDTTYKEYTELQKWYAAKEKEVEALQSNLELKAKEDLHEKLQNANKEAARDKERLFSDMQELRYTLSRSEEESNLRERMFKDEIASLQKRLQEAEERNEELTKNMSAATRPLVRQIENLQATYTTQTISWEKIEKNLTDRLSDAQNQVAFTTEKERAVTEKYLECQSKLTALESQNNTLRQEKLQLNAEIESIRTQLIMLEENKSRETYTLEKVKQNFNAETTKLKQEKLNLESTMATCLEQLDAEKRKVKRLEEEIKIKDTRALIMSNASPCPSPTGSARSSVSSMHYWSQDEAHEQGIVTPMNNYRMSVYESLRLGSGSSLLENLQSQLKQREGEIFQLQSEIAKLEQVKQSITRELVQLSEQNEELDKKANELTTLQKEHRDLDQKYNTLLQMYGEKVEETEELQLDLADVKSMYKAQIEELLMKQ